MDGPDNIFDIGSNRSSKMQHPLGPITCKTCGSQIRIWYEDDGKAIPFYEIICPNGEDHTLALDLPGTFLYAELVSAE